MADLNSLIAQGAQFRIPPPVDPMGNMPQLMQMRAAQNQNALAQYQLGAAQRTDEQQSALNALARSPNFNPNTPEGMRLAQQYGAPGYALVKSAREASSAGLAQDQARTNLLKEKMAMLPDAYRMADTPEAYAQLQDSIHADPVMGPWLNSIGSTKEKGVAALQDALTKPNGFDQLRMGSMKSVKDLLEGNKLVVTPAGSSVFDPNSRAFVGTAPAAPDKAPAPTDLARLQNERAKLMPGDPRIAQYDDAIRKATTFAPSTQVNVKLPALEGAELKGKGELNVKQYGTISDAARLATRTLPALDIQSNILDRGFRTGFGTDVQKAAASVLASLGVPEAARFATDSQTFLASTQAAVLQRQLEQRGVQTANDAQRIEQTGAQLGNTPEANRFLIDVAKGQYKRDIEQRNFFDKWWSQNKTYEGAEDAWYAGDGGKSLFDRPEIKKYAPKAPAASPVATKSGATVSNWKK